MVGWVGGLGGGGGYVSGSMDGCAAGGRGTNFLLASGEWVGTWVGGLGGWMGAGGGGRWVGR